MTTRDTYLRHLAEAKIYIADFHSTFDGQAEDLSLLQLAGSFGSLSMAHSALAKAMTLYHQAQDITVLVFDVDQTTGTEKGHSAAASLATLIGDDREAFMLAKTDLIRCGQAAIGGGAAPLFYLRMPTSARARLLREGFNQEFLGGNLVGWVKGNRCITYREGEQPANDATAAAEPAWIVSPWPIPEEGKLIVADVSLEAAIEWAGAQ